MNEREVKPAIYVRRDCIGCFPLSLCIGIGAKFGIKISLCVCVCVHVCMTLKYE